MKKLNRIKTLAAIKQVSWEDLDWLETTCQGLKRLLVRLEPSETWRDSRECSSDHYLDMLDSYEANC